MSPTSLEPPHIVGVQSRGQLIFVIVIPQAFFDKMDGLSRAMFFLDGQNMVLGELLTGYSEWGPGFLFVGVRHGSTGDRL